MTDERQRMEWQYNDFIDMSEDMNTCVVNGPSNNVTHRLKSHNL
jgi:hypothetical protein